MKRRKPKKIKLRFLRKLNDRFRNLRHNSDLADVLNYESYRLELLALNPQYHIFSVPKKDGSKRWIEDPDDRLQEVQARLNFQLNAIYYLCKPESAYGFVLSRRGEPDPRNIATNARQHLGKPWLFNADLEDFFHQVKAERVYRIFTGENYPFQFEPDLADLLVRLTTNQGRLPMGAPTSPVLSNFATLHMDKQLEQLAEWAGWTYTRYADDLAFSGLQPFSETDRAKIREVVEDAGFTFNKEKFKHLGPDDRKEITGVQLGKTNIEVPDAFLVRLREELQKLTHVIEVAHQLGRKEKWVQRYQQQIEGKVNFVEFVLGEEDPISIEIGDQLEAALDPPDGEGAMSWLEFGYW